MTMILSSIMRGYSYKYLRLPTASLSSAAPVGLFYSNPALTDGGQSSVRNLLSISRWRKAGGVF
jgi:hypothetical protein